MPGEAVESLRRELEALGLTGNEALAVLALLQLGSATSIDLARACQISRTNIYQLLEELTTRGLAYRLPGEGPATWATTGRDELLDRLCALHEEQLLGVKARAERVRVALAEAFSDAPTVPLSQVRVIGSAVDTKRTYDRLLREVRTELMMFTRSPFAVLAGQPNPAVLDALNRGVKMRVLYQERDVRQHEGPLRAEIDPYHALGVRGRVLDELPMKLIVFDRSVVLLGLLEQTSSDAGYPTFLLVENAGFAAVQSAAFEQMWTTGRPFTFTAG